MQTHEHNGTYKEIKGSNSVHCFQSKRNPLTSAISAKAGKFDERERERDQLWYSMHAGSQQWAYKRATNNTFHWEDA
eukprot:scaffold103725_cov19-Tisochrysis_lutea.AAC.2